MSKIYKIHKWLSILSVLFFLMFCITGLVLMFRTELNAWAQGGSHHSSSSMAMSQQE
ncbi:MAG: PepSY domain-containing protein, partial [Veillonella sp.]|uniref:PepSY domain-containing protein n=1 Tax=Veillonella sp. TaxID=1926307 RepID=UPI0028FF27C1